MLFLMLTSTIPAAVGVESPLVWVSNQSSSVKVAVVLVCPIVIAETFSFIARTFGRTVGLETGEMMASISSARAAYESKRQGGLA